MKSKNVLIIIAGVILVLSVILVSYIYLKDNPNTQVQAFSFTSSYDHTAFTSFSDISLTAQEYENQLDEMNKWFSSLDENNFIGCFYDTRNLAGRPDEPKMIILVKNLDDFKEDSQYNEAINNNWKFLVQKSDYSITELEELNII